MDHRESLLNIVKEKGPLLPAQINKEMHTNVLFASAMLAEMVDQKKMRLTSMKVGGSPLYYTDGQEHLLERFAHKLGEKDYRTFELLKKSRIIRDRDMDPQSRVSLREIKDFAIPLEVTADAYSDLFWKYYLVSDEDAKLLITDYINARLQKTEARPEPKEVQSTISETAVNVPEPVEQKIVSKPVSKPVSSVSMTPIDESALAEFSCEPAVSFSTVIDTDEKVKLEKKPAPVFVEPSKIAAFPNEDKFFSRVKAFFDSSGIEIAEFSIVKKASEYEFVINLPSNVGSLVYYCRAKSKAKISDADLSTAFVRGQIKKLPVLFLTPGELTKMANELLSKEFKSMFVKKI
jgi:hypothetical protein